MANSNIDAHQMSIKKNRRLVCGVGVNDCDYQIEKRAVIDGKRKLLWRCPFYRAWTGMIERCYSLPCQARQPTYIGCSITKEWLRFSIFRTWMAAQEWEGKEIDKDILIPGNKLYSPDTCVVISPQLNSFLVDCGAARGDWPLGVYWSERDRKFSARCRNPFIGKRENLGYFKYKEDAHEAWRKRKHELACIYADMQTDPRIAAALRTRYA